MKASIYQVGLVSSLKQGYTNAKPWITFALSTAHTKDSVTYHNYIMGGKLAEFWYGRLKNGDLVTTEANATQTSGEGNLKFLSWSVENFNYDGDKLPDLAVQFCEVTLKGFVSNLRNSKGFVTFGCGCKPYTSNHVIFFNVSMGAKLYDLYPVNNNDKVIIKAHMEPRKKGNDTYYNWYVDKVVKIGSGYSKAREPVNDSQVNPSQAKIGVPASRLNPAFVNENPNPFDA